MVRLETKWPSITSRWSMEAPPRSTRAISSARRAKPAERIEGTISIMCGLVRSYHSGHADGGAGRRAPGAGAWDQEGTVDPSQTLRQTIQIHPANDVDLIDYH